MNNIMSSSKGLSPLKTSLDLLLSIDQNCQRPGLPVTVDSSTALDRVSAARAAVAVDAIGRPAAV